MVEVVGIKGKRKASRMSSSSSSSSSNNNSNSVIRNSKVVVVEVEEEEEEEEGGDENKEKNALNHCSLYVLLLIHTVYLFSKYRGVDPGQAGRATTMICSSSSSSSSSSQSSQSSQKDLNLDLVTALTTWVLSSLLVVSSLIIFWTVFPLVPSTCIPPYYHDIVGLRLFTTQYWLEIWRLGCL